MGPQPVKEKRYWLNLISMCQCLSARYNVYFQNLLVPSKFSCITLITIICNDQNGGKH